MIPKRVPAFNSIITSSLFRRLILLIFVIINTGIAYGSMADIVESGIFGCAEDTTSNGNRYIFTKLPGLVLENEQADARSIFGDNKASDLKMLLGQVLVNELDSCRYYLGDDIESFSKVIRNYIPTIIGNNWALELIQLYLIASRIEPATKFSYFDQSGELTKFGELSYFKLDSLENYIYRIPPDHYPDDLIYLNGNDLRLIKSPAEYHKNRTIWKISITTWEPYYGNVENWDFEISGQNFVLIKYRVLYWGIKPDIQNNIPYKRIRINRFSWAEPTFFIGFARSTLSRSVTQRLLMPDTINRGYDYINLGCSGGAQLHNTQLYARISAGFSHTGKDEDTLPLANKEYFSLGIIMAPYLFDNYRFQFKPLIGVQYSTQYFDEERIDNMKYKGERTFVFYGVKANIFLKNIRYPNYKLVDTDRIVLQIGYERDFSGTRYQNFSSAIGFSGGDDFMGEAFLGLGCNYESYREICHSFSLYLIVFEP